MTAKSTPKRQKNKPGRLTALPGSNRKAKKPASKKRPASKRTAPATSKKRAAAKKLSQKESLSQSESREAKEQPKVDLDEKQAPEDKYTPAQVIKALRAAGGVITLAAEKLRCTRKTVRYYIKRYSVIKDAAGEVEDEINDLAEAQLIANIRDGYFPAVRFYLETKGKERGYTRRVEQTGADGDPIKHVVEDTRSELTRKFNRIADVQQTA